MKSTWLVRLGLAATLVMGIAGCGGGDDGATGPQGPAGPAGPAGPGGPPGPNAVVLTANTSPDTFANLKITAKVNSVTIASAPVVNFSLADNEGKPIVGFGTTSKNETTATVASYANLAFSLAKLVPGTSGSPSKWVSYIVTTVPLKNQTGTPTCPNDTVCPTRPSTDNTGTLVDNGDGTYKYTFYRDVTKMKDQVAAMTDPAGSNKADLGDLSWQPTLTHRLTIQISGNAPGTGTNTPKAVQVVPGVPLKKAVDVVYDFIPATGKPVAATDTSRDIVANANCESCHSTLGGIPGDSAQSSGAGFHGGSRNNVQYCVVCHTDQRKYGQTEATINAGTLTFTSSDTRVVDGRAVGNLPNYIHKVHLGGILAKKSYNYAGVQFNEVGYPQDVRNCTKCHDGTSGASGSVKTAQGDNWKSVPSRLACGACHDGINFATGKGVTLADAAAGLTTSTFGHVGGAQADDTACTICHAAAKIDVYHLPVTPPNKGSALHVTGGNANTNSAWIASNTSRLPAGAIKVSYDVQSVTRDSSKHPVMKFRMLQNGTPTPLNDFASATVNPATGDKEIWNNFMGSPSAYFVYAVPQDGKAAPADFNVSASAWLKTTWNSGKASLTAAAGTASLTGPDASGYYTVTVLNAIVPDNAVMLTGGLGYTYNVTSTLPLTQTNLADYPVSAPTAAGQTNKIGGLIVIAPNAQKVATGYTGRRAIVEDARCNACHQELGTFTEDAFHAGQRNDGTTCAWCHRPNQTSSGWSADSTSFVHAIHASAKRSVPYNWHATSATEGFWDIKYPGVLARCTQCHLPGTYDFSASGSANAVGLGADGIDKRLYRTVATGTLASSAANAFSFSPYITKDLNYGSGFSFATATGVTTEAASTTLVTSPTATVCSACHDSILARSHIMLNGGSLYAQRGTALANTEQCFVCHASDRLASITAVHAR